MALIHFLFAAAISSVSTATALAGINCTHPTAFYDQVINHSDPHSGTFKQQYQIIMDHYKPGGPILFMQGAETANLACLVRMSSLCDAFW
jgi:hypothetical protein